MKKKPFYKCWWFWLIIGIAFLLCVGNIVLAHFKKEIGANIFTAVSGWVSGIATVILGAIAVIQNRKYKEENDRFLLKQSEENSNFIESQRDISWRNAQYQLWTLYLSTLNKYLDNGTQYNFGKIHNDIVALPLSTQSYTTVIYEKNVLIAELKSLKNFLLTSKYCYAQKEEVFDFCSECLKNITSFFEDFRYSRYQHYVNTMLKAPNTEEEKQNHSELRERAFRIIELNKVFRTKLSEHIYQLNDFISGLYGISSEKLKTILENSSDNYKLWIEKVRNQEEQNNGQVEDDVDG